MTLLKIAQIRAVGVITNLSFWFLEIELRITPKLK